MTGIIRFDDLSSTVYVGEVPAWAAAALPGLYHSFFSTMEYFRTYDAAVRISTCVLDDPRHIIMFTTAGRHLVVLNKVFDIDPDSADRLCATLFRLYPRTRKIRLEIMFHPSLLKWPSRTLLTGEDNVIWLPSTEQEYMAQLGASTRKKLGQHWRRLVQAHPDVRVESVAGEAVSADLVHAVVEMNRRRMTAIGARSMYDAANESKLLRITRAHGRAVTVTAGRDLVAAAICQDTGDHATIQMHGYDSGFGGYSPGLEVLYQTVTDAVRRGRAAVHFGWGREGFKQRLGAAALPTWTLSVYRSHLGWWVALDDVLGLTLRGCRRRLRRLRRPGVRTAVRRVVGRRDKRSPNNLTGDPRSPGGDAGG